MRKSMFVGLILSILLLANFSLMASGKTEAPSKTLTVGFWQEPPVLVAYWNTMNVLNLISKVHNPGLWVLNDKDAPVPAVVEAIPSAANGGLSADGKTITVKLKKNVKWTDGEPFTSKDVAFTWQQIMSPKNTVASRDPYDKIVAIDTPDDYTVVIKLQDPYAGWTNFFVQGFLPEHVLKGKDSLDKDPYLLKPLGTGPYELAEYVQGDHITFERFDGYYGDKAKIDRIYIKFVPSQDAVIASLQAGDLDVAIALSTSQIPALSRLEPKIHLLTKALGRFEVYYFNMDPKLGPAWMQDVNMRKAIALGIDRQTIVDKVLGGKTTVPNGPWTNTPWENKNLKPWPYDPAQAMKILDNAGWKTGADGIREKTVDGKKVKLSFTHMTTAGNVMREDTQLLVKQHLAEIGVEMVIRNQPVAQMFSSYQDGGMIYHGKFQMYGQFMDYFPDPDTRDSMNCGGINTEAHPSGNNVNRVCDPKLEALAAKQKVTIDPVARKKVFDELQVYLSEKYYFIPVFNRVGVWGVRDGVTGLKPGWYCDIFWNTQEWDITK